MCTQYPGLVVSRSNSGIRTLRLNVEARKNAISTQMFLDIVKVMKEAEDDTNTVILAITGTGDYFSSGNDLNNFFSKEVDDVSEATAQGSFNFKTFVDAFIDFPKVLVALVNGPAVGVMVTLLGLCDLVYAVEDATFHTPFVELGQSPEGTSTYTFPRLFGPGRSLEIFCLNEKVSAREAEACGLVTTVFSREDFHSSSSQKLEALAGMPRDSVLACKRLIRRSHVPALRAANIAETEELKQRLASEEFWNAVMNFMTRKRKKAKM